MTLIHTPRVLWSVGKGLVKNRRASAGLKNNSKEDRQKLMCGILPDQPPHVYHGHAGLFGESVHMPERVVEVFDFDWLICLVCKFP
jgi:hypothetical protein